MTDDSAAVPDAASADCWVVGLSAGRLNRAVSRGGLAAAVAADSGSDSWGCSEGAGAGELR